jgi:hypothetical protein
MSNELAERSEPQSGQRFLNGSVPRLLRHTAPCRTAGGDSSSLPAGKDQKPFREFEGGALISAEGAVPSLLDPITNNRHTDLPDCYARPVGRGKYCGWFSIKGKDLKTSRTVYRRVNCGSWSCSYCGPRRAKLARYRIRTVAEELDLHIFLTLTFDPSKLKNGENAVRHIRIVFNKFREYLRRKYGVPPYYICVLEFTKRGNPHLHILLDRFIPQAWISKTWNRLGGAKIVDIRQVTVRNVARYLSKYLTKELILSAPKGTRRVTTARSIKLFPKFNSGISWELLRESIWNVLTMHRAAEFRRQLDLFRFTVMQFDEERFLKAFELVEDG